MSGYSYISKNVAFSNDDVKLLIFGGQPIGADEVSLNTVWSSTFWRRRANESHGLGAASVSERVDRFGYHLDLCLECRLFQIRSQKSYQRSWSEFVHMISAPVGLLLHETATDVSLEDSLSPLFVYYNSSVSISTDQPRHTSHPRAEMCDINSPCPAWEQNRANFIEVAAS